MATVRTVLGEISPDDLGITLSHEHLLLDTSHLFWSEPSPSDPPEIHTLAAAPVTPENSDDVARLRAHRGDHLSRCGHPLPPLDAVVGPFVEPEAVRRGGVVPPRRPGRRRLVEPRALARTARWRGRRGRGGRRVKGSGPEHRAVAGSGLGARHDRRTAVHDEVLDPYRQPVGIFEGTALGEPVAVEHRDVGPMTLT